MLKFTHFNLAIISSTWLSCTISAGVPAANAQSKQCESEFVSISRSGKIATEITFINQRNASVRLYWLDYSGQRKFYALIAPSNRITQSTYVTHPWVITDSKNNCLGVYYPDGQPRIVEIL
ncbi:hypothetical protein A2T98_07395 [Nodularia spumigena CENA596]|uniref:von Hippel-Lindau disease tumour suppressor beta domain-containing protein n=1 Tax=Nodularia spumigena CENA596 TaxID=1819295 RepID=A0A166K0W3_NODSP|nr:hypothetical protein [Nodularia spumigena]KZL50422.1 hypothetical protein A2T98_07395 [Nodularia spumigena CENA596]